MKSRNQARMNSDMTVADAAKRLHVLRWHRWLPAVVLLLAPCSLYGVNVPHLEKVELADLVSGRVESDETDNDRDLKALLGTGSTGRVEIRMTVNSGSYRWSIRQGETEIDSGTLESRNGWIVRPVELGTGLYSLEISRPGEEAGEGAFRRRIDFASGIAKGDLDTVRKSHEAVARHGRKDYIGTMKALEPVDVRSAPVPRKMREQLAWARIDGMFYFRKFEDIFPAIEAYKADHPASNHLGAVRECEMAAMFERGLKKSLESVRFQNERSSERAAEGKGNLMRFLSLAGEHSSGKYTVLPKRKLRQDLWTARLILGEEEAASTEIANRRLREEFRLHCALMCPEIFPNRADENIARMKGFLTDYPKSPARPRVELDMASAALNEGIRLVNIVGVPIKASPYFELARGIFSKATENRRAGIAPADVADAWDGILRSYYWDRDAYGQKDEAKLLAWSEQMISMSKPGDPSWRQAKLYQADLLYEQSKYARAAVVLDELVALGFKGNPSHDDRTSTAVRWRIAVAVEMGDVELAKQLEEWVRNSNCEDSIRRNWGKAESR